jgi:hypothetical protein
VDLILGAAGFLWLYWIVISVVVGEAVVQFFNGYALGSGWRGVAFYFCGALTVLVYGGSITGWLLLHIPEPILRGGCVVLVLALAVSVLVVQPGESDGRIGLPKSGRSPGGSS